MTNPYCFDANSTAGLFYTINISGGRASAYLLRHILDTYGGTLPSRSEAIFCNTGHERAETLDFVQELSERWHCPITWIEYTLENDKDRYRKD